MKNRTPESHENDSLQQQLVLSESKYYKNKTNEQR